MHLMTGLFAICFMSANVFLFLRKDRANRNASSSVWLLFSQFFSIRCNCSRSAAVIRLPGLNVPVSGGGYFRLKPWSVTRRCLTKLNLTLERPFVFYTHPWEIDPQQPRLRAGSRLSRFRHYVNLASTERKLNRLLTEFRFDAVSQVIKERKSVTKVKPVVCATA